MEWTTLTSLSPVDGRYAARVDALRPHLSEFGLIRTRVEVEIRWLIALLRHTPLGAPDELSSAGEAFLRGLYEEFTVADAQAVKSIERTTAHDVKAVEYWIRERVDTQDELARHRELIHFACTSEDINNLSWTLMLRRSRDEVLLPAMTKLLDRLRSLAHAEAATPMLSRTHGQTASPTTLGKELANVVARLDRQVQGLTEIRFAGKSNGAVGNFNAHVVAAPEVDWPSFAREFIASLGLDFLPWTTQIEPHDQLAELFDALQRVNTIVLDLDRDVWGYISLGYFRQRPVEGEVGSSTMPHKINPIDFENSEGNLGVANAMLGHLARKLPISRWQRDLTDSTVLRTTGAALAHTLLGWNGCWVGMGKLDVDTDRLRGDLEDAWEVLAEPVQMVMRRWGVPGAYERLKAASRGRRLDRASLHALIHALEIPDDAKSDLLALTPTTYVGLAERLAGEI